MSSSPKPPSGDGARIVTELGPRVPQIRLLHATTGAWTTTGSSFVVDLEKRWVTTSYQDMPLSEPTSLFRDFLPRVFSRVLLRER